MNKEDLVREKTAERLNKIDSKTIGNMSVYEVRDTYNSIKKQVESELNNKDESELDKMLEEKSTNDVTNEKTK